MMVLWVFWLYPATSFSQDEGSAPRALQVGVIAASPLYMQTADGRWEGLGVELWQDLRRIFRKYRLAARQPAPEADKQGIAESDENE
jgi:hypothetical protein